MSRRVIRAVLVLPLLFAALELFAGGTASAQTGGASTQPGPTVVVLPATGVVDNVLAGYIAEGILRADRDGASAVVIRLNTPGGSLDATQRTATKFVIPFEFTRLLEPIIDYVKPVGDSTTTPSRPPRSASDPSASAG